MGNIREGGRTEEDMGGPRVRDMWGGQGDEQRGWCKGALCGRKMQKDRLSIPRTPSPGGISGVPCVLPHGDHGNAGRSRYGQLAQARTKGTLICFCVWLCIGLALCPS